MAKKQIKEYIIIDHEYFLAEKTSDVFKEVEFKYQTKSWGMVFCLNSWKNKV